VSIKFYQSVETKVVSSSSKTNNWVCHYCGKKGHIRPFCYALQRYKFQYQKATYHLKKHQLNSFTQSGKRSYKEWRVKNSKKCNISFTTIQSSTDA